MDTTLTASEVIGELRKATRLYEVFKRAEEMIQVLVEQEKIKAQLQKDIKELTSTKEQMHNDINEQVVTVSKKLADVTAKYEAMALNVKDAEKEAVVILTQARAKADDLVMKAQAEVEAMKKIIVQLKEEHKKATEDAMLANSTLQKLLDNMKAKKEELQRTLEKIV
jgi:hypothetical protein